MNKNILVIEKNKLRNLNFSDRKIESMELNFNSKVMIIKIEGAYLKLSNEIINLKQGNVKIFNWRNIIFSLYDSSLKQWVILNENNYDILKEICEINFEENIIIRGFGKKTGQWLEYIIEKPSVEITFQTQ